MENALGRIVFLCVLGLGGVVFWDSVPFKSEITVYVAFCDGTRVDGSCKGKEQTANPTTYKALVDQQVVLHWIDGEPPIKMAHCAVRDYKNWKCVDSPERQDMGNSRQMVDGEFSEQWDGSMSLPIATLFYRVPKWQWYSLWFKEKAR